VGGKQVGQPALVSLEVDILDIKWWRVALAVLAQHCKHNTLQKEKPKKKFIH
jgi:hypothetical protein